MLQNKYKFNQSSVSLEIIGLPDYSRDDDEKSISIISKWKLSIINRPEIEGNAEHLKSIIKAIYEYSLSVLLDQKKPFVNELIEINPNSNGSHTLILKSTKAEVKPLKIILGNPEFSDIVNCIDQLKDFEKIKLEFDNLKPNLAYRKLRFINKKIFLTSLLPPLLALFSITILSLISINFYEQNNNSEDKVSFVINNKNWH